MKSVRRGQLFVDAPVQGALAVRMILYWLFCLLTVSLMLVCWTILSDQPQSSGELFELAWTRGGPALVGSLLLLPIVMVDCVRLSNRFAGPVLRLRRGMKQLADGELVQPVNVRKGDFWFDFAADFNRLATRVQRDAVWTAEGREDGREADHEAVASKE